MKLLDALTELGQKPELGACANILRSSLSDGAETGLTPTIHHPALPAMRGQNSQLAFAHEDADYLCQSVETLSELADYKYEYIEYGGAYSKSVTVMLYQLPESKTLLYLFTQSREGLNGFDCDLECYDVNDLSNEQVSTLKSVLITKRLKLSQDKIINIKEDIKEALSKQSTSSDGIAFALLSELGGDHYLAQRRLLKAMANDPFPGIRRDLHTALDQILNPGVYDVNGVPIDKPPMIYGLTSEVAGEQIMYSVTSSKGRIHIDIDISTEVPTVHFSGDTTSEKQQRKLAALFLDNILIKTMSRYDLHGISHGEATLMPAPKTTKEAPNGP